jgi:hypothetical protein
MVMALSPLIVLILLLFLASIALIFLFWSLLTLRTPHLVVNTRQLRRQDKEEANTLITDTKPQPSPKVATDHRTSVYNSVVYPQRNSERLTQTSRDELKQRLSNNQVRGLNAQIPVPNSPPVEAVVTRKHSYLDSQEALEPRPSEAKTSKFQVVTPQESPVKPKSPTEQVPLFDNLPEPPLQLLNEEKEEEEDVFERFIRSKNDDLGF